MDSPNNTNIRIAEPLSRRVTSYNGDVYVEED